MRGQSKVWLELGDGVKIFVSHSRWRKYDHVTYECANNRWNESRLAMYDSSHSRCIACIEFEAYINCTLDRAFVWTSTQLAVIAESFCTLSSFYFLAVVVNYHVKSSFFSDLAPYDEDAAATLPTHEERDIMSAKRRFVACETVPFRDVAEYRQFYPITLDGRHYDTILSDGLNSAMFDRLDVRPDMDIGAWNRK